MSAKRIGHRKQSPAPAPAPRVTCYDDLSVAAPRFTSASDKLAFAQRENNRRRSRGDVRPSCKSKGNGYYAERLHTWSTRFDIVFYNPTATKFLFCH